MSGEAAGGSPVSLLGAAEQGRGWPGGSVGRQGRRSGTPGLLHSSHWGEISTHLLAQDLHLPPPPAALGTLLQLWLEGKLLCGRWEDKAGTRGDLELVFLALG